MKSVKKTVRYSGLNYNAIVDLANSVFNGDFSEAINYLITQYRVNSKIATVIQEDAETFKQSLLFAALNKEAEKKKRESLST
jgi:hypothetical protein